MDIQKILRGKQEQFETYIADLPRMESGTLRDAMAYSYLAQGKRLRPSLFLLAAETFGADSQDLLPFAAGIEMIHTYSLIHDDLPAMDNDDYRRGKPTCHKIFGDGMAVLAGDGLLTEAFQMMISIRDIVEPARLLGALEMAASHSGIQGMVYGQSLDIEGEGKPLTLEELKTIHYYKTGALLSFSMASGALLAGAKEDEVKAMDFYGRKFGLAFQITDDILDATGSFETLGKPIGSDQKSHKTTYVTLLGIEGARSEARKAMKEAKVSISKISRDLAVFHSLGKYVIERDR
ncbi:MAG TPA: polyprenyl synthetase family protein [Firmicutes bacterium]|nr:polyprenyl synthetase family protein [Bacillota bacterium]